MSFEAKTIFDPVIAAEAVVLRNEDLEVRVSPFYGSNMYKFRYGKHNLIYCDYELLKDRDWTGCFVLWPLPNRIKDKQYEFNGQKISVRDIRRKRGNYPLIHGLVDDQPWRLEKLHSDTNYATAITSIGITEASPLFPFFPFESKLTLEYILTSDAIQINYEVWNNGKSELPFGFALHPYFSLLSGAEHTLVTLPAENVMLTDEQLLPSGELLPVDNTPYDLRGARPVKGLALDHVFTTLTKNKVPAIEHAKEKLRILLESSDDFTHLVLYTMERPFICFENQTGATDMINLYNRAKKENNVALEQVAHLLRLPANEVHKGFIKYKIQDIL